jgi:integrase
MLHGRERWMGLGPYPAVPLATAREKAEDCRRLRNKGVDPIEDRKGQRAAAQLEAAKSVTFKDCASAYIESHRAGWKNKKHETQWERTLEVYTFPVFGSLPVQNIDTGLILEALEPIWRTKPETATRVRQRIESVLDWAKARDYRDGDNPARWRGHLSMLLPKRSKVRSVQHHPAMAYADLPGFFEELHVRQSVSARALAFTILTAARSGEVRGMTWAETDMDAEKWTVPGERMKTGRRHRVPLSEEALSVLRELYPERSADDALVFPGLCPGKPMSENTMRKFLQEDMRRPGVTVHGFRSAFRDWAAERTNFPREIAEAALAHVVKDKTETAYLRGDVFDRRRKVMNAWAKYCASGPAKGEVVPIRHRG